MLIYNLLVSRRTIHQYRAESIDKRDIVKAIQAGLHAPNHRHTQPWRFTLVGGQARKKIADLAVDLKSESQSLSNAMKEALRDKFINPPYLVAVSQVTSLDPFQLKEDYAAIACAIQNMSLCLWPKGIGTKWSTGKVTHHKTTYQILSIDSTREEIVGFFWIGYPTRIPPKPPKSQLKDVLREVD